VKIIGIDWGEKRIGLALAEGKFAEPYGVVGSFTELAEVIGREGIERVLLGLPEGKHRRKVGKLKEKIEKELGVPVVLRGEILTTHQAREKAIEAGKPRKARRELDSFAAALLLQEYLDTILL